ncbi:UbiA family prenyltransferase [Planktothrix sp. FACHB-1355]|uniref:UbiA family prenyltransferase n=2 Tax=Cyanophyceae TaxID=3028117 RepID=A0A926VMD9_9CYAN|nr:UbiA family prenyltransferase [Aerosakkonema funiforme FACHB-1375]MBD3560999.1 UbiA family prenyltransferase [Planktothrix sp. FACHB-1355]
MFDRWWIYQRERFPIVAHGVLIAIFSSAAISYSVLLRGGTKILNLSTIIVAFISVFLFFLQLRIADEFKDFDDDLRYRPYRPVPRGLVSLRELGWLGVATGIIQLSLAVWLTPTLALLLGLVWLYFGLMCKEFFVHNWLKAHLLAYMCSHIVIVPLINLYATACDWLVAQASPPADIFWFLVASFFNGMVIEIGRKIRSPKDEEFGVETYSAVWGRKKAVFAWLGAIALTAIASFISASQIDFATPVGCLLAILFIVAIAVAWLFLRQPITKWAKLIEKTSSLWTLLVYLSLGIVPLTLRLLHYLPY